METPNFNYHPDCEVFMKEDECFNCGAPEEEMEKKSPIVTGAGSERFPEEESDGE